MAVTPGLPVGWSPAGPPVVGDIEQFLQAALAAMPRDDQGTGPGRPRILPSLCVWSGLLVCVLRGFTHHVALWRLLSHGEWWFYPRVAVSDEAVAQRLARAGTGPLEWLFGRIRDVLHARLAPYAETRLAPFASEVVALDETTLDPVARQLPILRALPPGDDRLLPGKLAGVFDIRRQLWRRILYHPDPHQNEKRGARALLTDLAHGALIVADLGYFGFAWFDDLTTRGFFWVSRLRAKTSYQVLHAFYQRGETFDGLIWLGTHRADRARYAVRLVQFRTPRGLHRYVTNVLDPRCLPAGDCARLYARRWDIELAFNLIKTHLGLHLLWSSRTVLILQQVWAVLIIAQILQALRLEIAGRAGVDPFDVSLPLLVEYLPRLAAGGQDPVRIFVEQGRALRFIRPAARAQIHAPYLPRDQLVAAPPDLVLERTPRYAARRCAAPPPRTAAYAGD